MDKGYFGIGIINPKNYMNVGSLWRSANIFDANFIFTIGKRIAKQSSDTMKTCNSLPFYYYESFDQFYKNLPYSCKLVGIELDDRSIKSEKFKHPERCIYLLGAEDSGIPIPVRNRCHELVQLPKGNFNVANAGSIIMYDRYFKML